MRAERETLIEEEEEREREGENKLNTKEAKRDATETQRGLAPAPASQNLQDPLSTVASAGSQMSVFTCAPISSLSPFPGPEL